MMATLYQMQAKSSANAQLYSWLALAPDWAAAGYVTAGYPGTAQDVTLSGGGFDTTGASLPANTITLADGSSVTLTDGSYATTV